jgi:GNAT superfamily N-acetyltransferase
MEGISIRQIAISDRDIVSRIAYHTAFLGDSGTSILDDKNMFFDLGFLYFMLFEKKYSFVADYNDHVIGYLLSTFKIHRYFLVNTFIIIPFIFLPKLIFFRYRIGKKTLRFFYLLFIESLMGRIPRASLKVYPAELHINLSEEARGKGIASLLMQKLMDVLASERISGIQLNTTSENKAALKLYERFGFIEYKRVASIIWQKYKNYPVDNVTLVREVKNYPL